MRQKREAGARGVTSLVSSAGAMAPLWMVAPTQGILPTLEPCRPQQALGSPRALQLAEQAQGCFFPSESWPGIPTGCEALRGREQEGTGLLRVATGAVPCLLGWQPLHGAVASF